jgi:hypothetical protein
MDARRGRLAAALAAALIGTAALAGAARAATVTAHPPAYAKPSAGPFTWTFAPSGADAPVAWKLSSETAWHRCTTDTSATFATLPEGRYAISVADDDPDCSPGDTTPPPTRATVPGRGDVTVVDGTPPVVPPPVVTRLHDNVFQVDASAAIDALSGIASATWIPRAGATPHTGFSPRGGAGRLFTSTYPPGMSTGSITVTDLAGNSATQAFTIDATPLPDVTPPTLRVLRLEPAVVAGNALRVVVGLSERATVRIAAAVRIAGRSYRAPEARRSLVGNRWITVRVPLKARVRRSIARALRRRLPVRATVRVVAVDRAGHPAVPVTAAVRITG